MSCAINVSAFGDCSACVYPLYTCVALVMQHRLLLLCMHDAGNLHGSLPPPLPAPHPSSNSAGHAQRSPSSLAAATKASQ